MTILRTNQPLQVIAALTMCHDEHPRLKFFGVCNKAKNDLDLCFKAEKIRKRDANFKRAKESDAYVRQKMYERRERMAQAEKPTVTNSQ